MNKSTVDGSVRHRRSWYTVFLFVALCLYPIWDRANGAGSHPFDIGQNATESTLVDQFKAGEILVKFKPSTSSVFINNALQQYNATISRTLYQNGVMVWNATEGRELELIERLNADPLVEYAEPNYRYHAFVTPNDPHFSKQWGHVKTNSTSGWDLSKGLTSTVIAIIDTGIDENHPDLKAKIVAGRDFVDDDANPHDTNGHGTHVAGIAAAITNNATGVAGMNWNARIMPIRALGTDGSGYTDDIVSGIAWAYTHGADVLNLSLGGPDYSQTMQDAINSAYNAGCLVVAAMGNKRTQGNPTSYPAANANVMAVAATNSSDTFSYYSQYGAHCDISAPGGEMSDYHDPGGFYSTMPTYDVYLTTYYSYNKNYDYLQGTSQAAPMVSGLAALLWAINPALTPSQVQMHIQNTAVDLGTPGKDADYGYGRINTYAALKSAQPQKEGAAYLSAINISAIIRRLIFLGIPSCGRRLKSGLQ